MENNIVLEVKNLCKTYPAFELKNVSFSLKAGTIMGFIGRNGAGKTTTLKCLLNFVHPSDGSVEFLGMNFNENEDEIKQEIGFASGGVDFYKRKKIKDIVNITKTFYKNWDEVSYKKYMELFKLDENKRPFELSEGMKVKFNLVIALSHGAKVLLLDEPTSGLDPVSREDLLDVFMTLAEENVAILFSTHITSDLDKCAEYITYIKQGQILSSEKTTDFINKYKMVSLTHEQMTDELKHSFIGINRTKDGYTGLILNENSKTYDKFEIQTPNLEDIMTHIEKGSN